MNLDREFELALLNDWQRAFPLVARPFGVIARRLGRGEDEVLAGLRSLRERGAIGRIGAVWARGAGGAGALCAMSVAPHDVERVAALVNREPAVNHNYQREHAWNLWYVLTGRDESQVRRAAQCIERAAGYPALFLPMVRDYRVDLGFDLRGMADTRARPRAALCRVAPVGEADRPLAALAEDGLALVERPFDLWAAALGRTSTDVMATLHAWQSAGTLRRFGVVVRHHDVGFASNAMTVIRAPEARVDAIGELLAAQPGVTLAYRRVTDPHWPYNLYFMVHGRERSETARWIESALYACGADRLPHETLFSTRRFKQVGGRYFSGEPAAQVDA